MGTKVAGALTVGERIGVIDGMDYGGAEVISIRPRHDGERHDVLIDVVFPSETRTPWSLPAMDALTQVEVL